MQRQEEEIRRKKDEERLNMQRQEEEIRRKKEEELLKIRQFEEAEKQRKLDFLKSNGYEGYYEYRTISLTDNDGGSIPAEQITNLLNEYALYGWHLKCAYANEIGVTSHSSTVLGHTTSTNSTIDQNLIILERYIKF